MEKPWTTHKLKNDIEIQIDIEDLERIQSKSWQIVCYSDERFRVETDTLRKDGRRKKWLSLAKFVMNAPDKEPVTFLNSRTDFRKSNLRKGVTAAPKIVYLPYKVKKTSKYLGVSWSKSAKKWRAIITVNKKRYHLGFFETEEQAYLAYCNASFRIAGIRRYRAA